MIKLLVLMFQISLLMYSCNARKKDNSLEKWKREIVETEMEFAKMAQNEGIQKAFLTYAADDAVLMRNNILIIGKESLKESFDNRKSESGKASLTWEPDFVDVSASGDLGYTYGKYIYSVVDSVGNVQLDSGIFHTVWKRQPDGKWRFVWD
jgi:ketosteroid isomerase-like protein